MKIAVPHSNGNVWEHFGKSSEFKIYELADNSIKDSSVVESGNKEHDELASFLKEQGVDLVICGNIGQGAEAALSSANIQVISGTTGNADDVIKSFINGDLISEGVNCSSCGGSDEGCGCGGGCGSSEGGCGGCGGGCGGCGSRQPLFEGPNVGKACIVHYRGTFNDGTCFDSSYDRGEPIQFICGVGMMIRGFDEVVATMNIGDKKDVHLMPEEAYGPYNPDNVLELDIKMLPGSENLNVGDQVFLANAFGQEFPVKVIDKSEEKIKFDANHEMAGKELNFTIELLDIIEE